MKLVEEAWYYIEIVRILEPVVVRASDVDLLKVLRTSCGYVWMLISKMDNNKLILKNNPTNTRSR